MWSLSHSVHLSLSPQGAGAAPCTRLLYATLRASGALHPGLPPLCASLSLIATPSPYEHQALRKSWWIGWQNVVTTSHTFADHFGSFQGKSSKDENTPQMKWQEWMISQGYFIFPKINVMDVFSTPSLLTATLFSSSLAFTLCVPTSCALPWNFSANSKQTTHVPVHTTSAREKDTRRPAAPYAEQDPTQTWP